MAYTKQTWECGDVISAEKLNHMEDGIEASGGDESPVFLVDVLATKENDSYSCTSDATFEDIKAAWQAGKLPIVRLTEIPDGGTPSDYYNRMALQVVSFPLSSMVIFSTNTNNNHYALSFIANGVISLQVTQS